MIQVINKDKTPQEKETSSGIHLLPKYTILYIHIVVNNATDGTVVSSSRDIRNS